MSDSDSRVFNHPHLVENLGNGNLHFALRLYKQCITEESNNILVSPFSISSTLGMAFVGARGETATQIRELMRLGLVGDDPAVHAAFENVLDSFQLLTKETGLTLHVHNRVYLQDDLKATPEFLRILEKSYHANVARFNFVDDSERTRLEVNHRVVDDTHWKVRDLVRRGYVNTNTRILAVSALFFKGEWISKFKPMRTKPSPFHLGMGRSVTVEMMQQRAEFKIAVCDEMDSTIVELPYVGKRLSMFVFLPKEVDGMPLLEANLTTEVVTAVIAGMRRARVTITLPRFRIDSNCFLDDKVPLLGLADLFKAGKADLSGVSYSAAADKLHISALLHRAFVDVTEDGSEAGAATGLSLGVNSVRTEPDFVHYFVADHPFIFMIRDNLSGCILFIGRLMCPPTK